MPDDVQRMVRKWVETNEFMQYPKRSQNEWIIDGARARPDIAETKRPDDYRILRQVLLVIPYKSGLSHSRVGKGNREQQYQRETDKLGKI